MSFKKILEDVKDFHTTFEHPVGQTITMQTPERANARGDWVIEEGNELKDAKDVVEQIDAYLDGIYFNLGGLVECGVDSDTLDYLWDMVHQANMSKVWEDGKVHKNEQGKVMKPANWKAPDDDMRDLIVSKICEQMTEYD